MMYTFQILFLPICFSFCQADLLQTVLEGIQDHWEIYILSDSNIIDSLENSRVITKFLYSSGNQSELQINPKSVTVQDDIRIIFQSTSDVAIIVRMGSQNSTFDVIEQIGIVFNELRELRHIWIIAIWPELMTSQEEINKIRYKEAYQKSVQNFVVNSHLFFTFNLTSFSEENPRRNVSKVVNYEGYRAGNFFVFNWLQNGVVQWNCNFCDGFALRRFNFHQRILRVTAVNDTEINDDIHVYLEPNGTVRYSKEGFSASLLVILQQLLNFTVEPTLSKEFGELIPGTKNWTGSIGEIAEGKFDLAMSITILRPERATAVSFLPPADEHHIHAFFKPPEENRIRDIFAQPFKPTLWAAVLATWIVLASCMIIFSMVRKRYGMDEPEDPHSFDEDEKPEPDFTKDSFIWAVGTVCQQGWDDHPRAGSLRALFLSGSVTGWLAYAGYSAAIVSTLSLHIDPTQNPQNLLDSHLRVGIRKGFISSLLEQNGTHDTMSRFYKKVERARRDERYFNVSSGLEHLLRHPYAFITTTDTMYDLLKFTKDEKTICEIKDLPILKLGYPLGYPVPRFSPFREILRYAMTMIREPGVLNRLKMKYAYKRRCIRASNNAGYALGANDVFTAFMVLCGGIALSLSFLFVERIIPIRPFPYTH